MSGSLNRVQLIGHLGADPEIRRTQDGRPIELCPEGKPVKELIG